MPPSAVPSGLVSALPIIDNKDGRELKQDYGRETVFICGNAEVPLDSVPAIGHSVFDFLIRSGKNELIHGIG